MESLQCRQVQCDCLQVTASSSSCVGFHCTRFLFLTSTAYLCVQAHNWHPIDAEDRWKTFHGIVWWDFVGKKNLRSDQKEASGCFCSAALPQSSRVLHPWVESLFCLIGSHTSSTNTQICPKGRTSHNKVFRRLLSGSEAPGGFTTGSRPRFVFPLANATQSSPGHARMCVLLKRDAGLSCPPLVRDLGSARPNKPPRVRRRDRV